MSSPLLLVENLEVFYGSIQALKGVSFSVNEGEVVSLIGANGAGKTTTLKAVSGLVPHQGQISFNGNNLAAVPTHQRVGLGIAQSLKAAASFPK